MNKYIGQQFAALDTKKFWLLKKLHLLVDAASSCPVSACLYDSVAWGFFIVQRLADMEDPELTDFWQLLGCQDAITPEIQQAALAAEEFWPCEIYYHAPADVRNGLIHVLLSTEDCSEASNLMSCLAFQGTDKAMAALRELGWNPRFWGLTVF